MTKPKPSSDTLIEMLYEPNPAKWAALQISTKGYGCKTVGEAMNMIESIVNTAIDMKTSKLREILDSIEHRFDACDITFQQSCPACRWAEMKKELGNE